MPGTFYKKTLPHAELFIDARVRDLRGTCETLFNAYKAASEGTEAMAVAFNEGVRREPSSESDFDIFQEDARVRGAQRMVELSAQTMLLVLDGFLSEIRFSLTGSDICRDDGPELRNGVSVDRALDAAGNYVRHSHEWFSHDWKPTWPQGQQLRSIQAIAKLFAPYSIDNEQDAYMAFTRVSYPMSSILDLLSDYENRGNDAEYATVEAMIREAALATARRAFPS